MSLVDFPDFPSQPAVCSVASFCRLELVVRHTAHTVGQLHSRSPFCLKAVPGILHQQVVPSVMRVLPTTSCVSLAIGDDDERKGPTNDKTRLWRPTREDPGALQRIRDKGQGCDVGCIIYPASSAARDSCCRRTDQSHDHQPFGSSLHVSPMHLLISARYTTDKQTFPLGLSS